MNMRDVENCQITHFPAQVLAGPAEPIENIDDSIAALVEKMTDIMIENNGIGLAGPQAGVPLQIFIISLDGSRENVKVFINPAVTTAGSIEAMEEGCLSIPGVYTKVRRYEQAAVTATSLDGKEFTEQADGLYAKALQHEYDHLQGVTIANKMGTTAKIVHRKQLKRLIEKHEQNSD